jgi:hypothetical protein
VYLILAQGFCVPKPDPWNCNYIQQFIEVSSLALWPLASHFLDCLEYYVRKKDAAVCLYLRGADKSLALHTSRCILFDAENISFDTSLVI